MTDHRPQQPAHPSLPEAGDAWLESMLRQDASAAPCLEDGGFTASVLHRLPARTKRSPLRWIVPGMGLLGFLVGFVSLSGGENLILNLTSLVHMKSFSLQAFLVAALPLALLYWLALGAAWQER